LLPGFWMPGVEAFGMTTFGGFCTARSSVMRATLPPLPDSGSRSAAVPTLRLGEGARAALTT
jgi:hypothetical protein